MKKYFYMMKLLVTMLICAVMCIKSNASNVSAMIDSNTVCADQDEDLIVDGTVIYNGLSDANIISVYSAENGVVKNDGVRLRKKQSTSATVLESMSVREKVRIDMTKSKSQNYKWYYIQRVKTGTWGWAKAEYIKCGAI